MKYYIMVRLIDRTKPRSGGVQLFPLVTTFLMASLWHGLYVGYFLFYLGLMLIDLTWKLVPSTKLAQSIASLLPDFFLEHILCRGLTHVILAYLSVTFHFMVARRLLPIYQELYYCWHVFMILLCLVSAVLPKVPRKKSAVKTQPATVSEAKEKKEQ